MIVPIKISANKIIIKKSSKVHLDCSGIFLLFVKVRKTKDTCDNLCETKDILHVTLVVRLTISKYIFQLINLLENRRSYYQRYAKIIVNR